MTSSAQSADDNDDDDDDECDASINADDRTRARRQPANTRRVKEEKLETFADNHFISFCAMTYRLLMASVSFHNNKK